MGMETPDELPPPQQGWCGAGLTWGLARRADIKPLISFMGDVPRRGTYGIHRFPLLGPGWFSLCRSGEESVGPGWGRAPRARQRRRLPDPPATAHFLKNPSSFLPGQSRNLSRTLGTRRAGSKDKSAFF